MPLNIKRTPATANEGVTSGVRGSLLGVAVSIRSSVFAYRNKLIYLPLKTEAFIATVGTAPLIFDVMAVIMTEGVGATGAEVDAEFVEGTTDEDPDPDPDLETVDD